jgi:hypothetical protein
MKILKTIGIALVSIIGLALIIAFFLPSEFTVSRSTVINTSADSVYAYVADFNQFQKWSPWVEQEPNAVITLSGDASTIGSNYAWNGTITGSGSMSITALDAGKSIEQSLVFTAPFPSTSTIKWTFETSEQGTKATWSNTGKLDYPIARFFGLGMDKMLGPDFEKGLSNLKKNLEVGI